MDAPVARYWPEFAAAGKDGVWSATVSHSSGRVRAGAAAVVEDLYDWPTATSRMAAQAPWWEPGTASGYHALNYGHLVGEVVRRVSGKTLKQFVAEEIAGPLGADFQIGAAEADWGRIADVVPPPPLPLDFEALGPDSLTVKTLTGPFTEADAANTPGWRRADMGAVNGHGNARSVARIMSVVARGGRPAESACCARRPSRRSSPSRSTASTWCSAFRCASASATGCPCPCCCPGSPTRGSATGAAGAVP